MDISTFTSHRRVLATASGEIAYAEFGSGPTALFVHGVVTSGALWRHVIEQVIPGTRCVAIDLPGHGGTPPRADMSVTAMAEMVVDLCEGLNLGQVDLVANDTGGAVAQLVAVKRPDLLRSLVLTNCDTEGNFPPPSFAPVVEAARLGAIASSMTDFAATPAAARASVIADNFEHPDKISDEVWQEYLAPVGHDIERARHFERLLAAMAPAEMEGVNDRLRGLDAPTLLVWGTGVEGFGLEWAYQLRDLIPGAREVIEVDGAKLFFPEERPEELAIPLRRHWGR
jgi:pimeloyl-ACP methyl ester carboxylesterase